jgi:phosphatidylglycerol---prolipoprotein diacylglyceryl transferase
LHPLLFQLGHFAIPTYGACTALALVATLIALRYFARLLGLNSNAVWNLGLIAILSTLVATRLLLVVADFSVFRRHPFWVLGLTANHSLWVDSVGLIIGLAAAILYAFAEGLPVLRTLDCVAPSVALAVGINRIGAFLAGLDYGLPSTHAWSVIYTSRIAAFWYGTPLGVALAPVQLNDALVSFALFLGLLWWLPRRTQDGELWGAWLFLYGAAGFFLAMDRTVTQTQWALREPVAAVMVVASIGFLLRRKSRVAAESYTVVDDSSST